jgi:hypothetical protein
MLSLQELTALTTSAFNETVDTPIGVDKDGAPVTVPQRGVTVREYVRYIVQPFKSVRSTLVEPFRAVSKGGADMSEAAIMQSLDMAGQIDLTIDEGEAVNVRLIALSTMEPGKYQDLKAREIWAASQGDEAYNALLSAASKLTMGADPSVFFDAILKSILPQTAVAT